MHHPRAIQYNLTSLSHTCTCRIETGSKNNSLKNQGCPGWRRVNMKHINLGWVWVMDFTTYQDCQTVSDCEEGEEEENADFSSFDSLTKEKQSTLVQNLLLRMTNSQHVRIDGILKRMLQRDFIQSLSERGLTFFIVYWVVFAILLIWFLGVLCFWLTIQN